MSTLTVKNRFVKSEFALSIDEGYGWNNVFDVIGASLTGGATSGLTAADNLKAWSDPDGGISGNKLESGAITTVKILADAINGSDDVADGQIIQRHLKFGQGALDPLQAGKMDLTPATATDAVRTLLQNNADNATVMIMASGHFNGHIGGSQGTTSFQNRAFADTTVFGDPAFDVAPIVLCRIEAIDNRDFPSNLLLGERVYNITTTTFSYVILTSAGNAWTGDNVKVCWTAIGEVNL